ncbi:hypothetical protein [Tomitella gaofuii]|uniref:hypothetical protein n=1 Tax=Tomitella gaofuii TaxID=2760083 RepID=UPI001F29A834|nr:hypothetical protein [Tomitella gaofuii]
MDITYAFGTGDGEVTEWTSPADLDVDGDGAVDAVALDFDGDGLIDDAMWDADSDGVADTTCLDVAAGAGGGERWFVDAAGDGTWATEIRVEQGAGGAPGGQQDGSLLVDSDDDGFPDMRLVDSDGDGYLDTAGPAPPPLSPPQPPAGSGSAAAAMLRGLAAVSGTGSWGVGVR